MKRNLSIVRLLILIISILFFTHVTGCKKDKGKDSCISLRQCSVGLLPGIITGSVNQNIPIQVGWLSVNSCGSFDHFEVSTNSNIQTIKAFVAYKDICFACSDGIYNYITTYNFIPSSSGTYYLHFLQPYNSVTIDTVIVN